MYPKQHVKDILDTAIDLLFISRDCQRVKKLLATVFDFSIRTLAKLTETILGRRDYN